MADQAHIDETAALAALFALGALPPDEAARFEQRLASGCALCQAELRESRDVVAALPLSAPEVAPPPSLRDRLFERIGVNPATAAASDLTLVRAGDTEWKQTAPGVQIRPLLKKSTMLVRLAPNTWLPEHDHAAAEQCLVLEGSISCAGVTAYAGDFTYMPAGSHHDPLYSPDGCLLLIAYT